MFDAFSIRVLAATSVTLRSVFRPSARWADSTPTFHSGQAWNLEQAVAITGTRQLGTQLSSDDVSKITAFLDSLTGDQPKVTYPVLPRSIGLTPQPQP